MKWALYERLRATTAAGTSSAVVTRLADGAQAFFDGERWEGAIEFTDAQCAAVRRSCQTIAGRALRNVDLSQMTSVSR